MLKAATAVHGNVEARLVDPVIEIHRNVLYVPATIASMDKDTAFGSYDRSGELIDAAAYRRGPEAKLVGQSLTSQISFDDAERSPEETYIYSGILGSHFGHFIATTLPRYWPIWADGRSTGTKFLFHGHADAQHRFAIPHVAAVFGALGLQSSDFVRLEKPTKIKRLIIPRPGMEELNWGLYSFAAFCRSIGAQLMHSVAPKTNRRPAYLSKSRLLAGIWHLANESDFETALSERDFAIFYPEQMSIGEQIALFNNRSVVCGTVGSAHHTDVFAENPARIVGLALDCVMYSTQLVIDKISGTHAEYFCSSDMTRTPSLTGKFHAEVRVTDPIQTAKEFSELVAKTN
jgi:hypothetical protein